jgi:hypothetical protein
MQKQPNIDLVKKDPKPELLKVVLRGLFDRALIGEASRLFQR